jgi:hypothetical protein
VPALLPISDRKAVAAAVRMFVQLRGELGDTQQATGAASTAASFAKVGTAIWPGIGTAIGVIVGAVVGWLSAKKKPVRASSQQVAQCKAMLDEYMSMAAQIPNDVMPLDMEMLRQLLWCLHAVYGAEVKLRDPRFFLSGHEGASFAMAKRIVLSVYETPVNQVVKLASIPWKDPKGRTITSPGFEFINKQFTSVKELATRTLQQFEVDQCQPWAGAACAGYWARAVASRLVYDMLGYFALKELPNISEADLSAASSVAATMPGTSAKDVVSAVESILQRNVERGETAQTLAPVVVTPPSTAPPTTTVPVPADALPPQVTPPAVSAPTLPPNASAADIQAALMQLTRQLMQSQAAQSLTQQQAITAAQATAQQWLNAQGVTAPAAAIDATAKAAVTQAGSNAPLWLGLAAAAAAFAFARPSPRSRSRLKRPSPRR